MKPNIKLAFDLDGVIANTVDLLCNILKESYELNVESKDFTKYGIEECFGFSPEKTKEIIYTLCSTEQTHNLKPIPGAIEFLQYWYELGNDINIITTRHNEEPLYLFLDKYAPDICVNIYSANPKTNLLKKLGISHFIEDHPGTALYLANAGITPIIYDQLYNRCLSRRLERLVWRIKSWNELRQYLEK